MLDFVFRVHLRLALDALLLFVVGLLVAWPVVHYRLRVIARPAEVILRLVGRLVGHAPSIARLAAVIFCYNAAAMFVYMASGVHPLLPMLLCIWVGANIGILLGVAQQQEDLLRGFRRAPGQWKPGRRLTLVCSLLVLALELPCFWLAIAMGMSMGYMVRGGSATYGAALAMRAHAYVTVIVPILFASATAEAIAVRGSSPLAEGHPAPSPQDEAAD